MRLLTEYNDPKTSPCLPSKVILLNRTALFVVFFWFGALKILQVSPAEALITHLHHHTIDRLISVNDFLIGLGVAECCIGILWLIPRLTRYTLMIFMIQMTTTFLPLFMLPAETWDNILTLSLSGQYILKNIVLIACAFTIYSDCRIRGWSYPRVSIANLRKSNFERSSH